MLSIVEDVSEILVPQGLHVIMECVSVQPGHEVFEGRCVAICPSGQHHVVGFGDSCVPICPEGQINKPPTGQCGCQEVPGGVLRNLWKQVCRYS